MVFLVSYTKNIAKIDNILTLHLKSNSIKKLSRFVLVFCFLRLKGDNRNFLIIKSENLRILPELLQQVIKAVMFSRGYI
jgi:hypothetical protein